MEGIISGFLSYYLIIEVHMAIISRDWTAPWYLKELENVFRDNFYSSE